MNKLTFIEKTHQYFVEAVSVSKIVESIYPFNKSSIPPEILEKAIIKGNCVHNALENYINFGINNGCGCKKEVKTHTKQIKNGIIMLKKIIDKYKSNMEKLPFKTPLKIVYKPEFKTYGTYNNWIIAGTIDLVIYNRDEIIALLDWKTTKDLHKDKYTLQLELYEYLITKGVCNIPDLYIANVNRNELININETKGVKTTEMIKVLEAYCV